VRKSSGLRIGLSAINSCCGLNRLDHGSATTEQVHYQHYRGDNEKQVNQRTAYVADQAQQPQHEKNNEDRPKHLSTSILTFDNPNPRHALACRGHPSLNQRLL
jgi:hypothetical protein